MRAEGKAFCSDGWYLLAGVLLQKPRTRPPSKRKASTESDSHTNGVSVTSNGHSSNGHNASGHSANGHIANGYIANGHSANGHSSNGYMANGHSSNGYMANGHSPNGHSASGHTFSSDESGVPQQDGIGDCSGLRHRYSTDADGVVNAAEDQLDELIQVMTALR